MISESQEEERKGRVWAWALPLSVVLHALLVPWSLWAFSHRLLFAPTRTLPETVFESTAVRLERRPVPQPANRRPSPRRPQPQPAPEQPQRPSLAQQGSPISQRPEIAKVVPSAPPQTAQPQSPAPTTAQRVARDSQSFSKEVADISHSRAPLSVATVRPEPPASLHRDYANVPGTQQRSIAVTVIAPVRRWTDGSYNCYYVDYTVTFPNGASEEGVVPWPACYPKAADVMRYIGVRAPIPYPPPGYVLPPGTYMSQFLRGIYDHSVIEAP